MPSSGVSKMIKVAVLAVRNYSTTCRPSRLRQRSHWAGAHDRRGDVDIVSFKPRPGNNANGAPPASACSLVGGLEHDDGEAGIGRSSATTLWIRAHCSAWRRAACRSRSAVPWTERTAPWALAAQSG
jgi:hypothetical protein